MIWLAALTTNSDAKARDELRISDSSQEIPEGIIHAHFCETRLLVIATKSIHPKVFSKAFIKILSTGWVCMVGSW